MAAAAAPGVVITMGTYQAFVVSRIAASTMLLAPTQPAMKSGRMLCVECSTFVCISTVALRGQHITRRGSLFIVATDGFFSGATTIHTSRMAHGGRFSHHRMANVKRICGPSSHHRMCVEHTSRYGMASRKSSFSKPCASFHIQFCCCCECVMCF